VAYRKQGALGQIGLDFKHEGLAGEDTMKEDRFGTKLRSEILYAAKNVAGIGQIHKPNSTRKRNHPKDRRKPIDLGICSNGYDPPYHARIFIFEDFPELRDCDSKKASAIMDSFPWEK